LMLARVFQRRQQQIVVITFQTEQAQRMLDDLKQFGIPASQLFVLPALESRWMADDVTDHLALGERIAALSALASGDPCIVVGTAEAVFQRTSPPEDLVGPAFTIRSGRSLDLERTIRNLVDVGYESETTVARPGQFS